MNLNRKRGFHETFVPTTRKHLNVYNEFRKNELRLISDLNMARQVQQQLLQRETCDVPGVDLATACVPACELGGDFYNFLPYGNGQLGLALGDVSGKGTAAALLGALVTGILRAHIGKYADPPQHVLASLNHRIHAARLDARFVVMLFAVLDSGTQQLTLANAGNPYPFLLRKGGIEEIEVSGIPLGLMEDTRYEAVSLDLQLGDIVVFVSDGILECQNREQEAFGARRLAAVLTSLPPNASAEDISSAILDATGVFSHDASALRDDRSLIVLRLTDKSSPDRSGLPIIY
jgi:sigma-B regulation protein RsbU (phosphoserine phosphatase)